MIYLKEYKSDLSISIELENRLKKSRKEIGNCGNYTEFRQTVFKRQWGN